jgi:hypothetical protein
MNLPKQANPTFSQPKSWEVGEYEKMKDLGNELLEKYRNELWVGMSFEEFQQTAKKHKQNVNLVDRGESYRNEGWNYRYEIEVGGTFIFGYFTPFLGNTSQDVTNKAIRYFKKLYGKNKNFKYVPHPHFPQDL